MIYLTEILVTCHLLAYLTSYIKNMLHWSE